MHIDRRLHMFSVQPLGLFDTLLYMFGEMRVVELAELEVGHGGEVFRRVHTLGKAGGHLVGGEGGILREFCGSSLRVRVELIEIDLLVVRTDLGVQRYWGGCLAVVVCYEWLMAMFVDGRFPRGHEKRLPPG